MHIVIFVKKHRFRRGECQERKPKTTVLFHNGAKLD